MKPQICGLRLPELPNCLLLFGIMARLLCAPMAAQTINSQNSTAPAEQTYKNIQVLKGFSSNQLLPAMQFITASLGVDCSFCHVENHLDQDDKKPKQIARKMMQMMTAINQANFEGNRKVTCNTCHHGFRIPAGIPAISEDGLLRPPDADTQATSANLPGRDDLINKFVVALGGEKAIENISSRVVNGTAIFAGREIAIEVFNKAPDKSVSMMHLPNGDSVSSFDGQQGWVAGPGRPAHEMSSVEVEGARMDDDLQFALHLKKLYPELKPALPETITGHDAYQLIAENSGQPRLRLYFDQQTGLLLRLIRYGDSPLGLNPVRVDYQDYRAIDGVQVPYRWTVARPSGQFTIQVNEMKQNVPIDDARFARPSEPAQTERRP